jgi:ubiquinone biosynthesis protein COQ9
MNLSERLKVRIAGLQGYVDTADADGFDEYVAGKMWAKEDEIEFLKSLLQQIEYAEWNEKILRDYQDAEYKDTYN